MKRLSYMACLLLASAAFTACDEDFKDWADPQSNPQEEAITAMVDITPVASMKLEEQPGDRKSTRLNSSHWNKSRMPSSA